MLASIAANFGFGLWLERLRGEPGAKALLGAAVALNLGLLVTYKYAAFLAGNANAPLPLIGAARWPCPPSHSLSASPSTLHVSRTLIPGRRLSLRRRRLGALPRRKPAPGGQLSRSDGRLRLRHGVGAPRWPPARRRGGAGPAGGRHRLGFCSPRPRPLAWKDRDHEPSRRGGSPARGQARPAPPRLGPAHC